MSASWHLAPSLVRLRAEVNTRWPNRSKRSDGTIGDAAHSARVSDHNPNARRSVNALDVTRDGIDPMLLVNRAIAHPSTNYVIFNRRIWSRSRGFNPRSYTGSNPHTGHVHISIRQARDAEQDTRRWGINSGPTTSPGLPGSGVDNTPNPAPQEDIMATKEELAVIVQQQVNAALISYSEKQNRFLDRTADGSPARATSHFVVQGHAAAIAAARNSAAVLGRVSGLETAIAALAQGRGVDKALLTEITEAAESGVRRGLEGAVVTVELGD